MRGAAPQPSGDLRDSSCESRRLGRAVRLIDIPGGQLDLRQPADPDHGRVLHTRNHRNPAQHGG